MSDDNNAVLQQHTVSQSGGIADTNGPRVEMPVEQVQQVNCIF
jgi:hypothetical protein